MEAGNSAGQDVIGRRVLIAGHFDEAVLVEAIRPLGTEFELRVRRASGSLEEAVLSADEFRALTERQPSVSPDLAPANA